jgi:hypothetical protein
MIGIDHDSFVRTQHMGENGEVGLEGSAGPPIERYRDGLTGCSSAIAGTVCADECGLA